MAKNKNNTSYDGNLGIKAAGVHIDFTAEQLQEYMKCMKSCEYFVENYVKIISVDKGLISFNPYPYQKRLIEAAVNNRYVIAKFSRQSGKTQSIAAVLLWYFLFNEHFRIAILANKEEQSIEILSRIKLSYENLPFWLQQGIVEWNKKSIHGENGSKIMAAATSASGIRGQTINILMLDEFAHVEPGVQEDFFTSVFPTISSGHTTKVIITSTPHGLDQFYKLWVGSERGKNAFVRVDSHWSEMPGRDEAWHQEQLKIMSSEKFDQEFGCDFLGSTNTLISGPKLRFLAAITKDPIATSEKLRVYHQPEKKHVYLTCVDTAEGTNKDYSAFIVFDITEIPYKICAIYQNNTISSFVFPSVIHPILQRYNDSFTLIETNNQGQQVADILQQEYEYEHVLMTTAVGRSGVQIASGFIQGARLGLRTTVLTKRIGCGALKTLVEDDKLLVEDFRLISELSKFTLQGKSYKAEPGDGNTDDLVMCCVILGWFNTQAFMKDLTNVDLRENLLNQSSQIIYDDIVPVGFIDGGNDPIDIPFVVNLDAWLLDDGNT